MMIIKSRISALAQLLGAVVVDPHDPLYGKLRLLRSKIEQYSQLIIMARRELYLTQKQCDMLRRILVDWDFQPAITRSLFLTLMELLETLEATKD